MSPSIVATFIKSNNPELYNQVRQMCTPALNDTRLLGGIYRKSLTFFKDEKEPTLLFIAAVLRLYSPGFYYGTTATLGICKALTDTLSLSCKNSASRLASVTRTYMKNRAFAAKVDEFVELVREGV